MTESHPPRVAEAFLESFGADAALRDAIIGDLAQEHASHAERYGRRAARLWYYRQAVLASPALARNWLGSAGWSDARRLVNVVGLAYVVTMLIEIGTAFAIAAVAGHWVPVIGDGLLGRSGFNSAILARTNLQIVAGLISGAFGATCAGYLSATFEDERPMIGAAAFAAASAVCIVLGIVVSSLLPPPAIDLGTGRFVALRIAAIPLIAALSLAGGAIRVRVVSGRRVAAVSSGPI